MAIKPLWRLAIIVALFAALGLLAHAGLVAVNSAKPAAPQERAPVAVPTPPAAPEPPPATAAGPRNEQMRLAEAPKLFTPAPPAATDYSYSLRQQRDERTILPGVTIGPGKALNVKTAKKDETIRITRDSTYPSSDYQVLWQKKY